METLLSSLSEPTELEAIFGRRPRRMLNRQRQKPSLEVSVKDVNVVLGEKEEDIVRLRREIEALRSAIPLLSDDRPLADDETAELQPPKFLATGTAGRKGWRRRFTFMSR